MPSGDVNDQAADAVYDAANEGGAAASAARSEGLPLATPDAIEQEVGDQIDDIVPTRGYQLTPTVGLGGSAGGIQALTQFFEAMPADSGLVFVVVLHLSPEHESSLPGLLAHHTAMPVVQAEDGMQVQANHVYVIPPRKYLSSVDGCLRLTHLEPERGRRMTVDVFFRTLADTHGAHATAVVLSGVDGDGAIGLKRVKERGGLTIAQDPDEAEHSGMPHSAIATGMVDWVLRAGEIPQRLLEYTRREKTLLLPPEDGPQPAQLPAPKPDENETALRDILAYLQSRTGHDFSYYKRATILRRISRRLQINAVETPAQYLTFLRMHPGESGALLQDLLISVTNFFRDRDAFATLEGSLASLFRRKNANDHVRVWVPACATGEEAYSVAMLLYEHARTLAAPPHLQVFATDLSEEAIQAAREGVYPTSITTDVSEERIARFFVKEHRGYRVRRELREIVLFAQHDLLKDSPFSKLDLITCRNLFIYLNREAQQRAVDIFHFALRPGGQLFLGTSESVDDSSELFAPRDKKHRLFVSRPVHRVGVPVPVGPGTLALAVQACERASERPVLPLASRLSPTAATAVWSSMEPLAAAVPSNEVQLRMLAQFGPPVIIVNAQEDIIHLSGSAARYLQFHSGTLTRNLLGAIHPMLRIELRTAMYRANQSQQPAHTAGVPVDLDGERQVLDIEVIPAQELAVGHLVINLLAQPAQPAADAASTTAADPVAQHLERELESLKTHLRDLHEQHEVTIEEHKSSSEELQAINEELRSASEELETSREELQSINEELTTVNSELKARVDELGRSNGDLQNLMAATNIATVFLDRALRITRYTPNAVELFKLIPTDVGRPLEDVKHRLDYPELERDAAQVLARLTPVERVISKHDDGWFLARLQPYRTMDDHIAGVVLTFVDITERKRAEDALQASEETLTADLAGTTLLRDLAARMVTEDNVFRIYEEILSAAVAITQSDAGTVQTYDPSTRKLVLLVTRGFEPKMTAHFQRIGADSHTTCGQALKTGERTFMDFDPEGDEDARLHAEAGYLSAQSTPLVSRGGTPIGMLNTHWREVGHRPSERQMRFLDLLARQTADLLEHRQTEVARHASEERLRLFVDASSETVYRMNADWSEMLSLEGKGTIASTESPSKSWLDRYIPADEQSRVRAAIGEAIRTRSVFELEHRCYGADGAVVWLISRAVPLLDERGEIVEWFGAASDVTERRRTEEAFRVSEGRYRLILESARTNAILTLDSEGGITSWNPGAENIFGWTAAEIVGQSVDTLLPAGEEQAILAREQRQTAAREGRCECEKWFVRRDGSRFWGVGVLSPLNDDGQASRGFLKIMRDATAELQAREAREEVERQRARLLEVEQAARQVAEDANAAKDHFLAVLSHELRTPLTPIIMALGNLAQRQDLPAPVTRAHEMIRRNVELEARFIDDMLDVTRIARGKMEIVCKEVDLHEAIQQAVEVSTPDVEGRGQKLTITLEAVEARVNGDFARLQQVFWNLLKNTSKFTPQGGQITLRTQHGPGWIVVTVTDTGIGLEAEALGRIFQPFDHAHLRRAGPGPGDCQGDRGGARGRTTRQQSGTEPGRDFHREPAGARSGGLIISS